MKTVAKVFIIIGMIAGFWMIFPPILGSKALKKIKNNELTTGWKVIVFLFVSWIGGLCLFFVPSDK